MTDSRVNEGKDKRIRDIFEEIAEDYDKINQVISFGQIDRWRKELVVEMNLSGNQKVLEVGCGTGKLTRLIAKALPEGEIMGIDCTQKMINQARTKLSNRYKPRVSFSTGKGEDLNFPDSHFDLATSAFTLRNVENIEKVLIEMKRVVKPGGKIFSLELAKPRFPVFRHLFYFYFNNILPILGGMIHGREYPYRHLPVSLQRFPNQSVLKTIFEETGLEDVYYKELFGGIAAIHSGKRREIGSLCS